MTNCFKQTNTLGFALLLTLVVVSVVLAIGLTLLDITLKQLILSSTGRESEIAFHAAYAGAECAQHWRVNKSSDFEDGLAPTFDSCLGLTNIADKDGTAVDLGNVYFTEYEMTWGDAGDERCNEIDIYIFDAENETSPVTEDITYYGNGPEECAAGSICTLIFSRGYNRSCANKTSLRTVQREVVVEF